jgi:hypothetical protein
VIVMVSPAAARSTSFEKFAFICVTVTVSAMREVSRESVPGTSVVGARTGKRRLGESQARHGG